MRLTPTTFFNRYIADPLSSDLIREEKILALALSILLVPLTLGIAHIIGYIKGKSFSHVTFTEAETSNQNYMKVIEKSNHAGLDALKIKQTTARSFSFSQHDVSSLIESQFIQPFYSKKLPPYDQVTVPYKDGDCWENLIWVKWINLSKSKKIEVYNHFAHDHSRIKSNFIYKSLIDLLFFGPGLFGDFLKNDPRIAHGSDHCCRTALFSPIFAYLYGKYHPDYNDLSSEDFIKTQIAAAGHDSGRQTEGVDVYDQKSAENTVAALKTLGVNDKISLNEIYDAINNKDEKNYAAKSLTAKCVQNADSAEYFRLWIDGCSQSKSNFNHSRNYLDIYNELNSIARNDKAKILKNNLTYGDFLEELDFVRKEMNLFIFATSQRSKRKEISSSKGNYYDQMKRLINSIEYPLLNNILQEVGVKETKQRANEEKESKRKAIASYKHLKRENLDYVSTSRLESTRNELLPHLGDEECKFIYDNLENELLFRKHNLNEFNQLKSSDSPLDDLLLNSYGNLRPAQRDLIRTDLLESLGLPINPPIIKLEISHAKLNEELKNESKPDAENLYSHSLEVLKCYNETPKNFRDLRILTTVSLALEKACLLFLDNHDRNSAKKVLGTAATEIPIDEELLGFHFDETKNDDPIYLIKGSNLFRYRRMRVSSKHVDNNEFCEISFELTSKARNDLKKKITLLQDNSYAHVSLVQSEYPKRDFSDGKYYTQQNGENVSKKIRLLIHSEDKKITFDDSNIEIFIGNDKFLYNQYHNIRIRMKPGTSPKEFHKCLSKIGLPMTIMQPRQEDFKNEGLNRSLTIRHPDIVYRFQKKRGYKCFSEIYQQLNESQKNEITQDLTRMSLKQVGDNQTELVNPRIAEEAWRQGLRSLGFFVQAGDIENTSQVMVNILQTGLLSTQARFDKGILKHGDVPMLNYWQGSANQVFTRPLTKEVFSRKVPLNSFSLTGPITILISVKAFERMPFTYYTDHAGLRNPQLFTPLWTPFPQAPSFWFNGKDELIKRPSFPEYIKKINKEGNIQAETMFDMNVPPQYFDKLLVQAPKDKFFLIKILNENGIFDINGIPLSEAIIVTKKLTPDLIDNFNNDELEL